MEEYVWHADVVVEGDVFVVRAYSDSGGVREYQCQSAEEALEMLVTDAQAEFEKLEECD